MLRELVQAEGRGKCAMLPAPFLDVSGKRRAIDHILKDNENSWKLDSHQAFRDFFFFFCSSYKGVKLTLGRSSFLLLQSAPHLRFLMVSKCWPSDTWEGLVNDYGAIKCTIREGCRFICGGCGSRSSFYCTNDKGEEVNEKKKKTVGG